MKRVVRRHSAQEGSRPPERRVDTDHVSALSCKDQSVVVQRAVQFGSSPSTVTDGLDHHRSRGLGLSRKIDTERPHTPTMPDVPEVYLVTCPEDPKCSADVATDSWATAAIG